MYAWRPVSFIYFIYEGNLTYMNTARSVSFASGLEIQSSGSTMHRICKMRGMQECQFGDHNMQQESFVSNVQLSL